MVGTVAPERRPTARGSGFGSGTVSRRSVSNGRPRARRFREAVGEKTGTLGNEVSRPDSSEARANPGSGRYGVPFCDTLVAYISPFTLKRFKAR